MTTLSVLAARGELANTAGVEMANIDRIRVRAMAIAKNLTFFTVNFYSSTIFKHCHEFVTGYSCQI
jgi:hypothetical protein